MSKLGGVTETGTVISNLPLLFADGMPTSLEIITEKQIEKFILLMLNCAGGREYFCRDNMTVPIWWPDGIPFSIPIAKPFHMEQSKWLPTLKSLVKQCYAYHGCQFMLKFCVDLAQYPTELLKFVDLCDGTTSLHNKNTGKLLVTFRNQNLIYDRVQPCSTRKKSLLPRKSKGSSEPPRARLIMQPTFIDIYLCDSCDAEFETLREVRDHEQMCQQEHFDQLPQSLRSTTPDDLQEIDQPKFLDYLDIGVRNQNGVPIRPVPCKGKYQPAGFLRCGSIPISSPLGLILRKHTHRSLYVPSQSHIDRLERFCLPMNQNTRTSWTHHNKTEPKKPCPTGWAHTYSFNKRQRLAKYEALETGLSLRSRRLLKKCPRVEVTVTRLTQEQILQYKNGVSKGIAITSKSSAVPVLKDAKSTISHTHGPIPVIDLCSSDDEDSCVGSLVQPPNLKLAKILMNENAVNTDDSCSSELINNNYESIPKPLPSKYLSRNVSCNMSKRKSVTAHKRSKRGRKSLACENETVTQKQSKTKMKLCDSRLQHEAKSKLQELNKIKESCDSKSKDWFQQFHSTSQANHEGKKYSAAV